MTFSALDSALVGPLFATPAMRDVFSDRARLAAMLRAEQALAAAQARIGLVPAALAPAIAAISPESFDAADLGRGTALAGVPTIPFVKAVQALLPDELERSFHKGATTQDILDTALVLQMRDGFALLSGELRSTIVGLTRLAATHRETPCVGRSYGQHAAPLSFGFKVAVWAMGIAELAGRLDDLERRALAVSLGGPVGTLAAMGAQGPAVADAMAAELGLSTAPIAWHTRRAGLVECACWLAMLIGALAKMATDIVSLASTEIGEVAEPYVKGRGGSSAMPHKRNPVSATIILSAHAAATPLVGTMLQAMAAAHERPAGLWHAEWTVLPQLFGLASGALHEAAALAQGLGVDPRRMRANLDATHGLLFADAVASALAPHLGREAAHTLVEHAAGAVRDGAESLRAALEADPAIAALGDPALLDRAFSLGPSVAAAAIWTDRALAAIGDVADKLPSQR